MSWVARMRRKVKLPDEEIVEESKPARARSKGESDTKEKTITKPRKGRTRKPSRKKKGGANK